LSIERFLYCSVFAGLLFVALLLCCTQHLSAQHLSAQQLILDFSSSATKEKWIAAATRSFNESLSKTRSGKVIVVNHRPMGSGDCIDATLIRGEQRHIVSPASTAFIDIGNARSQADGAGSLIGPTQNLAFSPVVIVMRLSMAEALGWPESVLGWNDIFEMAKRNMDWTSRGHPEWGHFKFAYAKPSYSNSGLVAVLADAHVAKQRGAPQSFVRHGSFTTGFAQLLSSGNTSAVVLDENQVVDLNSDADSIEPVVGLYPREGTVWSDYRFERVGSHREQLVRQVRGLSHGGGTALYDAVKSSYDHLAHNPRT
jgi:Ca-activated chloride channel family protein